MQHISITPGAIIGWTRRGPIRIQAGGSENAPEITPTAEGTPTDPAAPPAQETETDWKAEARKWEKRAKDNSTAAEQLEKYKAASMSEQEKAIEKARKEGESTATIAAAKRLARAEFKAAIAAKGLDLGDALELIDTAKFVDDKGEVDEDAIKKAVTRLAKIAAAKAPPGQSGGDFTGSGGTPQGRPASIHEAFARKQT
ncbi:hypothetical protein [Streptosporangium sp. NPDC006930]|uniref:hypothetical protein n=1 Tax=Streptosporangium sp. NPDC006930 TaxID=3154783 RepID=UPI003443B6E8